jgi:hypothetical protein
MISFKRLMFFGTVIALPSFMLLVAGCDSSSDTSSALAITPPAIIVNAASLTNVSFTASGGTTPYTWSVSNATIGTVAGNESNAVYTPYGVTGLNGVMVTDANTNTVTAYVTQGYETTKQGLTILPGSITVSASVTNYISFIVSGSNPPYIWSVSNTSLGVLNGVGKGAVYTTYGLTGDNFVVVSDVLSNSVTAAISQE